MPYSLFFPPPLGWAWASAKGWDVSLLGVFAFPSIIAVGSSLGTTLGELHSLLATALAWVIGFHGVAALYHHYKLKDVVLQRMPPEGLTIKN